ncbi:MAG TPA: response regulator, partial [Chloroflexota bacterium]|nr:response regulator [Chloroflexota bacterium]
MDSDTDGGVGAHDMTPYAAPPQDELVLIADDEPTIAEVVAALVTDAGYRAVVATHGRQALELAQTVWPALVITDLMMPVLDGAGLIAALQEAAAAT